MFGYCTLSKLASICANRRGSKPGGSGKMALSEQVQNLIRRAIDVALYTVTLEAIALSKIVSDCSRAGAHEIGDLER